jgi:hypothetical protein
MGKSAFILFAICTILISQNDAFAQQDNSAVAIKKIVKQCVDYVHNYKESDPNYQDRNTLFDAFYNSASGKVENNALLNIDQKALYIFKKCMAEKGLPLQ